MDYTSVWDTGKMTEGLSLENALYNMNVYHDPDFLHNAGNDAAYTLHLYQALREEGY